MTPSLPAYAVFAAMLAAAGLPIYIHAPKFYVDSYGVSLGALGAVLFGLRLLDVVQDPLLGRLAEKLRDRRGLAVLTGVGVMAAGMLGLFTVAPIGSPIVWFAVMLTLVFSAYSFLTICFYAQGVSTADQMHGQGHLRLARWRETGALIGVCAAAIAPVAFTSLTTAPFAVFAVSFAGVCIAAAFGMRHQWRGAAVPPGTGFAVVLRDPLARRLLLIALLNAAPVAVSSTLFLFYVETALAAPGSEGPLLLLFFLSAACTAPIWGLWAERIGSRTALMVAMVLAIVAFAGAVTLGPGDVWIFALVCIGSGAAMGADLTLLPAIFARRMARLSPSGAEAFGLWSFVSKLALAFAAITLLPVLEKMDFQATGGAPEEAVATLRWLYAGVPCALKIGAILLLWRTKFEETVA